LPLQVFLDGIAYGNQACIAEVQSGVQQKNHLPSSYTCPFLCRFFVVTEKVLQTYRIEASMVLIKRPIGLNAINLYYLVIQNAYQ
jgi:hypothetical protein